ncbi:MAG: hypothetical protein ABSF92_10625 [Candidatus Acidiferrales bacterium]
MLTNVGDALPLVECYDGIPILTHVEAVLARLLRCERQGRCVDLVRAVELLDPKCRCARSYLKLEDIIGVLENPDISQIAETEEAAVANLDFRSALLTGVQRVTSRQRRIDSCRIPLSLVIIPAKIADLSLDHPYISHLFRRLRGLSGLFVLRTGSGRHRASRER